MQEFIQNNNSPLVIHLAADARKGSADYLDDQIWELRFGNQSNGTLSLYSTLGLRCRSFRIFPRFFLEEEVISDPKDFFKPIHIIRLAPDYLTLGFVPFPGIDAELDLWVPDSQSICGRYIFQNNSKRIMKLQVEIIGQLTPIDGTRMIFREIDSTNILIGQSNIVSPVLFVAASTFPGSGSYPSLITTINLSPGVKKEFTWSEAGLTNIDQSFTRARQSASQNWDGLAARIDLDNSGYLEILTGDQSWDQAFALTQRIATSLFHGRTDHLPQLSYVATRAPDFGYSRRGDGLDYSPLWCGQTPLETYYLQGLTAPHSIQIIKGIIENFLSSQLENGFIDLKPGLSGQRSGLMATPLLAAILEKLSDNVELQSIEKSWCTVLRKYLENWCEKQIDRAGLSSLCWEHPIQAELSDHPNFSPIHPSIPWMNISEVDSPGLIALLQKESAILKKFCQAIGDRENGSSAQQSPDDCEISLTKLWDAQAGSYVYKGFNSLNGGENRLLAQMIGTGLFELNPHELNPFVIVININCAVTPAREVQLNILAISESGETYHENVSKEQFTWVLNQGSWISHRRYKKILTIEISGLGENDQCLVFSSGEIFKDLSLLLPLWSNSVPQAHANEIIKRHITGEQGYMKSYGLPLVFLENNDFLTNPAVAKSCTVQMIWNTLIGEGLVNYGYRELAAELMQRLMSAITNSLASVGAFKQYYNADTGEGFGETNHVAGLAPLGLFLTTLGVKIYSNNAVELRGFNPFPWPVTIKYRGLTVLRQREKTDVIFFDGQTVTITEPQPLIVKRQSLANR